MVFRTKAQAQLACHSMASWKQSVIYTRQAGDRTYYSVVFFDTTQDKCKRCRKARLKRGRSAAPNPYRSQAAYDATGPWAEVACTGHHCDRCGNPFAAKSAAGRYSCVPAGKIA